MIEIKGHVVPERVAEETDIFNRVYNPDVLLCLANLSNDEVFTPPDIANQMLDMLPQELFEDPNTKFLDPACKSGVFLREIAKRLLKGLEDKIPDLEERIDHICKNQLYGIAITELTSLLSRRSVYCSKYPNGPFSISKFDNVEGNIRFKSCKHEWEGPIKWTMEKGKETRVWRSCKWCGASEKEYGSEERDGLESHAYEFIHTLKPEEITDNMVFDVIISNPPYQLSTGGSKAQATPLYNKFVEQAKKLNPRYMAMIIPARWYSGGFALDGFRKDMITDKRIRYLYDFIDSTDCFNGVQIKGGVCYFLWDRDHEGECHIVTNDKEKISESHRFLQEEGSDIFIRRNEAVSILKKVQKQKEVSFDSLISGTKPFGFGTTFHGRDQKTANYNIKLYERTGVSYVKRNEVTRFENYIDKYKVYISGAYGAGEDYPHQIINKPFLGEPGTCCTETFIVMGPFQTEAEAKNVISYLQTKFVRFLIMLRKASQHTLRIVYKYVPMQDFTKPWTDAELYEKYGITEDEIAFIDSMIRPMELEG